MKVLKIIKLGEPEKGNKDFAYSHFFAVRIKSGFLSYKDANMFVFTNRPAISFDDIVKSIESQKESIMREILDTIYSKNAVAAMFLCKDSFTTKIGDDDCKFCFHKRESIIDYPFSNPANFEMYKRK